MLSDHPANAVLAVTDLDRARQFYEGTLGFTPQEAMEGVRYRAGGVELFVYPSSYAGTNKATAVTFSIPQAAFDAEIADLRARGVTFETYDMEGVSWNDGVAEAEGMRTAWFTDPDGNILNVVADES